MYAKMGTAACQSPRMIHVALGPTPSAKQTKVIKQTKIIKPSKQRLSGKKDYKAKYTRVVKQKKKLTSQANKDHQAGSFTFSFA